jgi:hypothetical protein
VLGQEPSEHPAITVDPTGESWEDGSPYNKPHDYTVANDGAVTNHDVLSRVQHGLINHPTWHNPATFHVTYPTDGTLEVVVKGVSGHGGARLVISLDGAPALDVDFPDALPSDFETMHQYDGAYAIDVPAGAHTIVVENIGADWFFVSYRLTSYLTVPNLRVLVLSNSRSALLWVQNRENTWWNQANSVPAMPVNPSEIELDGFDPGSYRVELWDNYAGTVVQTSTYVSADGSVVLTTPSGLVDDVAYKVEWDGP